MAERIFPAEANNAKPLRVLNRWSGYLQGNEMSLYLGTGFDSNVYKYGTNSVIKVYHETDFLSELILYKDVTNEAARLCNKNNYEIKFDGAKFRILVNPIKEICLIPFPSAVAAISKYIPGDKLISHHNYDEKSRVAEKMVEIVQDGLSVTGVHICGENVKIVHARNEHKLIITDLCTSIILLDRVPLRDTVEHK